MKNKSILSFAVASLFIIIMICSSLSLTASAGALPSKYITEAKTPVLNQKNNPLCWAYSGSDMLSINAIKNGYAENGKTVFSAPMAARAEFDGNEHRHSHGYAWYKCYGGIDYALMAATSGKGLLYDSDYPTIDAADKAPVSALYSGVLYVDDIRILDISEMERKSRTEAIKNLIMEYGAVNTDAFIGDYNNVTNIARILPFDNTKASHAILLVGWDDNKYTDTGTGAYLMKNTWGENWGNGGYAWVSYNSEFGRHVYAANVVFDEDRLILTHTETIFASGNSADASGGEYGAVNVFDIKEKSTLYKAGAYTNKPFSEITVKVYVNLSDISKIKTAQPDAVANGTANTEGYYTFDLSKPLNVNTNDTVTALYIIKSGKTYSVFSEYSDPDFEMTVTSSKPGQSYTYSGGELREPKGNYIGTIIGKTEHKEPPAPVTEVVTTAVPPQTETDTAKITDTESSAAHTDEPQTGTGSYTDTESFSDVGSDTENDTVIPDTAQSETDTAAAAEDVINLGSALKKIIITVVVIALVVIVLFVVLILALIAASKKKKV